MGQLNAQKLETRATYFYMVDNKNILWYVLCILDFHGILLDRRNVLQEILVDYLQSKLSNSAPKVEGGLESALQQFRRTYAVWRLMDSEDGKQAKPIMKYLAAQDTMK